MFSLCLIEPYWLDCSLYPFQVNWAMQGDVFHNPLGDHHEIY